MAARPKKRSERNGFLTPATLMTDEPIAGVPGPGVWLVAELLPVSLFSLKASFATSTVGRTLLVPSPYSIKMSLLDAGLRIGVFADDEAADGFVRAMADLQVRVGVPDEAIVTHTIVKIRQEPKEEAPGIAYTPNVAYREFVHFSDGMELAFDFRTAMRETAEQLAVLVPMIRYLGKRGSFFQFRSFKRREDLDERFTSPLESMERVPSAAHLAWLDDFGPEANFDALNSFSKTPIKRERHRKFVQTIVPLGRTNVGQGFTHYKAPTKE